MRISDIKGIVPPIITPINENENIIEGQLRKLVNHCIEMGIHGIFVGGSYGETMSLTQKERNNAIKVVIDEVNGRIPVFCGVMDTSTNRVIENIKALEQIGGEVSVVTPAFYIKTNCQQEIARHFECIARNTEIPIIMYNIPQFTQVNISVETICKLSEIDRIIGLKESEGSIHKFIALLNYFKGKNFKLLQGTTDIAGLSLLLGADGIVPALAPVFPKIYIRLYEAAMNKDLDSTLAIQEMITKTCEIFNVGLNSISAAKYAMSLLGFTDKRCTKPCEPLNIKEEELISGIFKNMRAVEENI
jgi:4-hydroxy-tetrahydrodipicolinate synthase